MRRLIREEEPLSPSRRLSTLTAEQQSTLSERRGVDGRRLGQLLRGQLDWVVMRALEKDRNRRYESANALAADAHRTTSGKLDDHQRRWIAHRHHARSVERPAAPLGRR